MLKSRLSVTFVFLLFAAAVSAQNNRSAVSVTGSDLIPCITASPCRLFGAVRAVTNAGGEIIALDSACYGPFNIHRAVTVSGAPGIHAAISVPSFGITVNAGTSDRVTIRNLVLISVGGSNGITVSSAGETRILQCLVRGFGSVGIALSVGNMVIDRTSVLDNFGATGINVVSTSGTGHVTVTHCLVQGNGWGIIANYNIDALVSDSTIADNGYGVMAESVVGTQLRYAEVTL